MLKRRSLDEKFWTEKLKTLGLTEYEVRAYIGLIIRGEATAAELADITGIPYTKVYDALNALVNKGLVALVVGRPKRYRIIDPKIAFRTLESRIRRELETKIEHVKATIEEFLSSLEPIYGRSYRETEEDILILRGRINITNTIVSLLSRVEKRAVLVGTPTTIQRLEAKIPESLLERVEIIEQKALAQKGASRETTLSSNVLVVDDFVLFFDSIPDDLSDDSKYDFGIFIKRENLANLIEFLSRGLTANK